jgi:predicted MFS family arabinose efflux permease
MPNRTKTLAATDPGSRASAGTWILPFAATIFAMMTMQMSSLGFSPLLPAIQQDFGINYSQLGLFTGLYGLVAIALSIPGGVLAKAFGEKRMLTLGLLVVALGLLLLSLAPSFAWGLTARVIWLCGYRVSFVCVMTAIALSAPKALQSSAMGILGAMASLASVIGAPFGSSIGSAFGWRSGILGFAGMALFGAGLFWMFYRRDPEATAAVPHHGHGGTQPPDRSAFRTPVVWAMVLLGLMNMGGFSATFFVPSAAKTIFNMSPTATAYIISASYVTAIFANLLCGYLADRFNRWFVMSGLMVVLIPSCFAMMSHELLVFRIATALVISLGLCATNQIYPLAGEVMGGRETGPVMGIVSLGGGVFGYLGPQMLGLLRDWTGGFTAGWYFVAGGACVALLVIVLLKRYTDSAKRAATAEVVA